MATAIGQKVALSPQTTIMTRDGKIKKLQGAKLQQRTQSTELVGLPPTLRQTALPSLSGQGDRLRAGTLLMATMLHGIYQCRQHQAHSRKNRMARESHNGVVFGVLSMRNRHSLKVQPDQPVGPRSQEYKRTQSLAIAGIGIHQNNCDRGTPTYPPCTPRSRFTLQIPPTAPPQAASPMTFEHTSSNSMSAIESCIGDTTGNSPLKRRQKEIKTTKENQIRTRTRT